jgi:hypothetical protein
MKTAGQLVEVEEISALRPDDLSLTTSERRLIF